LVQATRAQALVLFLAITMHKAFAAMSISTRFLRRKATPLQLLVLLLPYHAIPPLAVLVATTAGAESAVASLALGGLAAGTFLYIGAFEVVAEEFVGHDHAHGAGCTDVAVAGGDVEGVVTGARHGAATRGAWHPDKRVKFAMFALGVATLLGITAAIGDSHGH
jgi:ZIP Zinc transporter